MMRRLAYALRQCSDGLYIYELLDAKTLDRIPNNRAAAPPFMTLTAFEPTVVLFENMLCAEMGTMCRVSVLHVDAGAR